MFGSKIVEIGRVELRVIFRHGACDGRAGWLTVLLARHASSSLVKLQRGVAAHVDDNALPPQRVICCSFLKGKSWFEAWQLETWRPCRVRGSNERRKRTTRSRMPDGNIVNGMIAELTLQAETHENHGERLNFGQTSQLFIWPCPPWLGWFLGETRLNQKPRPAACSTDPDERSSLETPSPREPVTGLA